MFAFETDGATRWRADIVRRGGELLEDSLELRDAEAQRAKSVSSYPYAAIPKAPVAPTGPPPPPVDP